MPAARSRKSSPRPPQPAFLASPDTTEVAEGPEDSASFGGSSFGGPSLSGPSLSGPSLSGPSLSRAVPDVAELLAAAVSGIGGAERRGQVTMAEAVRETIETGEHLAVQAGTGTGKSLAYLVPAVRHALATGSTVVVATATIALQRQLIDRDLPRLVTALAPLLDREPSFAILKGRRNYLCLHRERGGVAEDPQDALFDPADTGPTSPLGRQVKRLHEWAEETTTGDRDELVPGVPEAAWQQVSVSAQECIGAQRCPFGSRCFAERARDAAARADIVVTNHALLAIDATSDIDVLPQHDVVIIDEAHDLVDRVTSATTGELSGPAVDAAARRAGRLTESAATEGAAPAAMADRLREAAAALSIDLGDAPVGRMDQLSDTLAATLTSVQDASGACADAIRASAASEEEDPQRMATARMTLASLDELQRTASRILDAFGEQITERGEVVWLDRAPDDTRRPPTLRVAPLEVGRVLRSRLFGERTVALTSATLALGGSFAPLAIQWGLNVPASLAGGTTPPDPPAPGGTHPPGPPLGGPIPPDPPWGGQVPPGPRSPSRGRESTSGRRSTIGAAASCTWLAICRRRAGTSCPRRTCPNYRSSSTPQAGVRSGCSPPCARQSRPPRRSASGSASRCSARATTSPPSWSGSSPRTSRPACLARFRCGRAWMCQGIRYSSSSSTGFRSRGRTTRSPRPGSARWPPAAATGS